MEYNQAYHLTCSLILDSSRSVVLKHLDQSQTYAGLLEGTPNKKANEWGIEADMKRASEYPQTIGKPHLVEPVRRDYLRAPGDMDTIRERTSKLPPEWGRNPEWLPLVRCIGCFQSNAISGSPMDASFLTVVWYQDEFAMPVAQHILNAIKSLDWDSLATDTEL